MNRGRESAEECARAVTLDPFDADLIACLGWHDLWAGNYDGAIATTGRALNFQPDQGWALIVMGWAYEQKGMFREASAAMRKSFPAHCGLPPSLMSSHLPGTDPGPRNC